MLFSQFLIETLALKEIDDLLSQKAGYDMDRAAGGEDEINNIDNPRGDSKIGCQMPGLRNFRLLSRANTSRLGVDELQKFDLLISDANEENLRKACTIVERTFGKVMCINPDKPDGMTCLGPYSDIDFCFDNDAVVVGLVMEDIDDQNGTTMQKITAVADNMKNEMFPEISRLLGAKLELFVQIA